MYFTILRFLYYFLAVLRVAVIMEVPDVYIVDVNSVAEPYWLLMVFYFLLFGAWLCYACIGSFFFIIIIISPLLNGAWCEVYYVWLGPWAKSKANYISELGIFFPHFK